jgi:hypothetical protein
MSGDTTTGQIRKGLRYRESFIYWRNVRGRNGTLPIFFIVFGKYGCSFHNIEYLMKDEKE